MLDVDSILRRARGAVGARFRPQGRDPATGLDCIGLAAVAYAVPASRLPADYRLSGVAHGQRLKSGMPAEFRRVTRPKRRAGDLVLLRPGRGQWHLAVLTDQGFVHADARLRAVVETPGDPSWPIVAVFRRRSRIRKAG